MANNKEAAAEDLAIQNTLSMTIPERLELLASLIVDKVAEDQKNGEPVYKSILRLHNG